MIIGIDGNEANVEKRLGAGEYAFQLLSQFSIFKFQISNFQFQIYLKYKPLSHMPIETEHWKYIVCGPQMAWTQFALPFNLFIKKPKPDVFFTPTHYAPRWSPIPTVVLIFDLAYKFYPELFKKRDLYKLERWTKYSVKNASKILTISNSSKDDIIKQYNIPGSKIHVIYPGVKSDPPAGGLNPKLKDRSWCSQDDKNKMQNSKQILEKYKIEGDFILFVGTLQPRKNIVRLVEAYSRIVTNFNAKDTNKKENKVNSKFSAGSNNNIQLVIIGKRGWQYEETLQAPEKFGVAGSVHFLNFIPDEDLPLFYESAKCFVLPSLYEGFGLPVLEAMKYGCPVLTSNVSSLPEAGGDAALYCDPENVSDIAKQMERLISDKELRSKLSKKGFLQVKKFSWEKAARETLSVLEEVVKR